MTVSQTLADGAKVSGTAMRLRQFDGVHQYWPVVDAGSPGCSRSLKEPGPKTPVSSHLDWMKDTDCAEGACPGSMPPGAGAAPAGSQLMPSMGMTSRVHATVAEQPSEAFDRSDWMMKFVPPLPLASADPYVVLPGDVVSALTASSGADALQ